MPKAINAQFPEKLAFLFEPHRYKVAWGGRCGAKSWNFARAILIQGAQRPLRVLCTREIQKSIRDSVYKLLSDQIKLLGLEAHYDVKETMIRGILNGTEIFFAGLSTHTVDSIKSYEGCDVVWAEEAHVISDHSWKILIPTIRKEGSEIWVSFNPELETDPTYRRFITNPPDGAVVQFINWRDNPWFNEVSEKERLDCQKYYPDDYENIWEGKCRPAVEGAIYYKEIQKAQEEKRICNIPYDPLLKVHVVVDLGFGDAMAIGLVQRHTSEIRIIDYIEDVRQTYEHYSNLLKEKKLNWGQMWLPPTDGFSKSGQTGMGPDDIFRNLGWIVPKRHEITEVSVEEGIRQARLTFDRVYFNTPETDRLVECLKRYRRHITQKTETATSPVHDEFSHGADCFRYICLNANKMKNDPIGVYERIVPGESSHVTSGWAR